MKRSIILLAFIFVMGCVGGSAGSWVKNSSTPEELQKDYQECRGPVGPVYVKDGAILEEYERDLKTCIEAGAVRERHVKTTESVLLWTGWLPYIGIPISLAGLAVAAANSSDYCQRCMKSKGYETVAPKEIPKQEINECMRKKGYEWSTLR